MNRKNNKNDAAWEILFDHFDIVNEVDRNGQFEISSTEINELGHRQARLMTKFDHKGDLPKLFTEHKLSILPNSRGTYIIGRFETFSGLEYDPFLKPIKKEFPGWIHSLDPELITSESTALNVAYLTGMIDDVLGEDVSYQTLSGRMKSGVFNFKIKGNRKSENYNIYVKNSQIEIDGGYESINYLGIIEAKNSVPDNFMVRQLYYPFVLFNKKLAPKKIVKPIFFTYSENVFSFHEFKFEDPNEYTSIKKVNQKNFVLTGLDEISIDDIIDIYKRSSISPEPEVPFPQADNFIRVLDVLSFLNVSKGRTKDDITKEYGFDPRQSDYYFNSLRYFGMAETEKGTRRRKLTPYGFRVVNEYNYKKKMIAFVEIILSRVVFRSYFEDYILRLGQRPGKERAKELIRKYIDDVGGDTINRRASTVVSWVEWVLKLQDM